MSSIPTLAAVIPRSPARTLHRWLLPAALALAGVGAPGLALAADCTGVPEWLGTTLYNAGDKLQKANALYQATQTIWNAPPDHPAGAPYYTALGSCDSGGGNLPPSVALTVPYEGDTFTAGSNIDVGADARDSDGSIVKVEFFRGRVSLGVDDSAPYALTWNNAVAGDHVIKAVATDDENASAEATVTIHVTAPSADTTPPNVPTGLAASTQTASSINLVWTATSDNPGGSGMAGYTLFRNGAPVGSPTTTSFTDGGLAASTTYTYTVQARDNAGNHSAHSPLISATTLGGGGGGNCTGVDEWDAARIYRAGDKLQKNNTLYQAKQDIWNAAPDHPAGAPFYTNLGSCDDGGNDNLPPVVALTSPGDGASYPVGSTITVSAQASDSDGRVSKVEFFRGETSLGTDTSAPYGLNWTAASAGNYVLQAVATDNLGASTPSATVSITVTASEPDTTAPSVPSGLASPLQTARSISLSWAASSDNPGGSGVAGYDVYRDGGSTPIGSPAGPQFTDSGREPGTTYSYRVRARDNAGNASVQGAPFSVATQDDDGGGDKRVIGYFAQWGIYGRNYHVKNVDSSGSAAKLTHINYAFGNVRNNRCEVGHYQPTNPDTGEGGDPFADYAKTYEASASVSGQADNWDQPLRGSWNQLKQLKAKHPGIKVLISLGGWTYSRGFSEAAKPENRSAFVASCIDAYIRGNLPIYDNAGGPGAAVGVFDGIDIDWEYPVACGMGCGIPEDNANFSALMAEFRHQLDAVRPGLLLTAAVGAGIDKIRETDPASYHPYLDYINVMTYDFHGAWANQTNHQSGLFHSPNDPSTGDIASYNSNDAIEAFLSRGVPAAKLNLGIGFYGRGWTNVPNIDNGLYQSGSPAAGTYEAGIEDWKVLKKLGWPTYTDPLAGATWLYNGTTFWSVDTPELITEKMGYVKALGLGGAFIWEFSGDDAQGTLINSVSTGLK